MTISTEAINLRYLRMPIYDAWAFTSVNDLLIDTEVIWPLKETLLAAYKAVFTKGEANV